MSRVVPDEPCNVCLENYNKKIIDDDTYHMTGNKITCGKCDFSSCTHCTKRFLLESNNDAHCMNCKNPWNREFLTENFTKQFLNKEYKDHRENTLCDREKALLPATMKIIDRENKVQDLHEEKERFRRQMEEKLYEFDVKIWELENSSNKTKKDKNKFIKSCPVENCNGFLSSQWKCGICSTHTCRNCHEIIGKRQRLSNGELSELPEHTCNEDSVKTAMLLAKECKNCPKCAAPIYKIDGCNQMWCVECKTAFDWRTSEIITGHFHNPHYYEWVRQNNNGNVPREPGDNPCGANVEIRQLSRYLKNIIVSKIYNRYNLPIIRTFFDSLHRMCSHLTYVVIADLDRNNLLNDDDHLFNSNLDIRRRFLKNTITETDFKKEIQKKEKKRQKALNLKQIYQTFVTVCNDVFQKLVNVTNNEEFINCLSEIITFTNHINNQLIKHKKIYNCVTYQFNFDKTKERVYGHYVREAGTRQIKTINVVNIYHIKFKRETPISLTDEIFKY